MTWFAKVAAVFLAVLAIVGAIVWVNFLDRYIAASDARRQIGGNVGYENVTIPAVTSPDQNVTVGVRFFLRNPSGIAIDIMHISYRFYMDNLTDTRSFAEKGASIFVVAGGFFPPGVGYVVGPHSTGIVGERHGLRGDATDPARAVEPHLRRTLLPHYRRLARLPRARHINRRACPRDRVRYLRRHRPVWIVMSSSRS